MRIHAPSVRADAFSLQTRNLCTFREGEMMDKCDLVLDLSGMHCPYSLLELNATFKDMRPGATAEVKSDRASIVEEIERWCAGTGNEVVSVETAEGPGGAGARGGRVRLIVRKI
jgi:TusA-related sulfurtransferase